MGYVGGRCETQDCRLRRWLVTLFRLGRDGMAVEMDMMRLFSETGNSIKVANYDVELNEAQRSTLTDFVTNELTDFEDETGLVAL